jgi:hypothetical protein
MSAMLFDTPLTTLGDGNNIGGAVMSSDYDSLLQYHAPERTEFNTGMLKCTKKNDRHM